MELSRIKIETLLILYNPNLKISYIYSRKKQTHSEKISYISVMGS